MGILSVITQAEAKDSVISKLKERIKSLSDHAKIENMDKNLDEINNINVKLEHRVAELISENEHLKQTFIQLFDLIKPTRVLDKEHCASLTDQLNKKSVENADLHAQLQEQVLVTTTLQNKLRRLKGKQVVDLSSQVPQANTIAPGMYKIDLEHVSPKLVNNQEAHNNYIKYTQDHAAFLRAIVKQARSLNPLDNSLDYACKYVNRIQELLLLVSKMCPSFCKPKEKVLAQSKEKKVSFAQPVTSTSHNNKSVQHEKTQVSNSPLLPSTGVKDNTRASRS
ncbi:hypothetical protein Tco_0603024 [Tanacetum coccineum]